MASTAVSLDVDTVRTRGPVRWDIRGVQNNWNWRVEDDEGSIDDTVEYQTRFPAADLALVYRGLGDSAPLLATIRTKEWHAVTVTFPEGDLVSMDNAASGFTHQWPVKVRTLAGRKLRWEYEHPPYGENDMLLVDMGTGEQLGTANDNCLALSTELPETAMEELVITGTAALYMLGHLLPSDMTIATAGPEGADQWKYQEPNWWDNEEDGDGSEPDDKERDCEKVFR